MADRSVDYLLIGGFAAAHCARTLREEGADGSILLVGREPDAPYQRPPLSKEYLRGESSRDDALVQPEAWWKENDVELLMRTSVMKLDSDERVAKLSTKEEIGFGKALLATGANVRRLRNDGSDLEGIHYLRAFGNSDAIREDAEQAENVVLIGGSYIGSEVAACLTKMGKKCTIVMQEDCSFGHVFGETAGRFFHDLLESNGVTLQNSDELDRFEGEGRVSKVVTAQGLEIPCDMVVVGVGVMPDTMLAKGAGLEIGESGGVLCSATLETSVPGIYAAGDMCEYDSPHFGSLRVEHHDVAEKQGITVAKNMLGAGVPHDEIPYFFCDLVDWASLEYVGRGSGDPVIRGSVESGEFSAFYTGDDGEVTAALSVGRPDDLDHARRMIAAQAKPSTDALADTGTDLASL